MKKLFTILAFVFTIVSIAQAPQGFNYQATIRNNAGELLSNQIVLVKFHILQNAATGTSVYSENHTANTDNLGHINLMVGQGTATNGTFSAINWANGTYYLSIELNTGSEYVAMGTTQLLSVPYALHANTANATTGNTAVFSHYIGELFGGGIVVSVWKINGEEHGLITSLTDLSTEMPWTTPDFFDVATGALSHRDGLANTNAIVAQAGEGTNYAAGLCKAYNAGGFSDWYLPATWELNQCYNSAYIINQVLGDENGFEFLSAIPKCKYWSSTETTKDFSVYQSFDQGLVFSSSKQTNFVVRAVRRF